jgi:hypothetical protein
MLNKIDYSPSNNNVVTSDVVIQQDYAEQVVCKASSLLYGIKPTFAYTSKTLASALANS